MLEAAIELIAQKGLDGFTLNEVGEAAGYSRGLPVHYFGTKENLLGLVATHVTRSYLAARQSDQSTAPGLPRLEQTIRQYCAIPLTARTLALRMLMASAPVHPVLNAAVKELNAAGFKSLEDEVRAGIANGSVRADADPTAVAGMVYAFLRGARGFQVLSPTFDVDAVTEEFITALTRHLGPSQPVANAVRPSRSGSATRIRAAKRA